MTFPIDAHHCDYLLQHSPPPIFSSELAKLGHINQRITLLDTHISQLSALRESLRYHSRQLHNLLSPIHSLPFDVLSYIFQQLIDPDHYHASKISLYQPCLAQALILSSVSSHFRRVAFDTPKLWMNIPLRICHDESAHNGSSVLRHCIPLTPYVKIYLYDTLNMEGVRSAIDILLTPDVTRKVQSFELIHSSNASLWVEKLKGSSFPMLHTLYLASEGVGLTWNFGTLNTLTRFSVVDRYLNHQVILPPSVQYLDVSYVTLHQFFSFLQQCSNLVECHVTFNYSSDTEFPEPVTLNCLKRLSLPVPHDAEMDLLVERMRLPCLETLTMQHRGSNSMFGARLFCHNVSATLTTLEITTASNTLAYDNLYQLWSLPMPKLRELKFWSYHLGPFRNTINVLVPLGGEHSQHGSLGTSHLPALRFVLLCCGGEIRPHSLLDLLKKRRIDTSFQLRLMFTFFRLSLQDWSPELREELESIVGGRPVEVIWGGLQLRA